MNHCLSIYPVTTFKVSYFSYSTGESNEYMGILQERHALLGEGTSGPLSYDGMEILGKVR